MTVTCMRLRLQGGYAFPRLSAIARTILAVRPELDFGHSSSIAGDVYQAVECNVGEFGYIVYLTRRFKTTSGP